MVEITFYMNDCGECATITCAPRWGVASVGVITTER